MSRTKRATIVVLVINLASFALQVRAQDTGKSEPEAMYARYLEFASYVKGG